MIYTARYVMFLMHADPLRGQVGRGWALEIEVFLSPKKSWCSSVSAFTVDPAFAHVPAAVSNPAFAVYLDVADVPAAVDILAYTGLLLFCCWCTRCG